jgi:hypothetical protein
MPARAPIYDPESLKALARVLARAALDELLTDIAADNVSSVCEPLKDERRAPDQGETWRSERLDERDDTPTPPVP